MGTVHTTLPSYSVHVIMTLKIIAFFLSSALVSSKISLKYPVNKLQHLGEERQKEVILVAGDEEDSQGYYQGLHPVLTPRVQHALSRILLPPPVEIQNQEDPYYEYYYPLQYYQHIQPIVQPAPEEPWLEEESKEEEGDEEDLFYENYYINPTLKSSGLYTESPKKNYAPEFAYSKYPFPYKSLEQEDVLPSLREGVRYNGPQ